MWAEVEHARTGGGRRAEVEHACGRRWNMHAGGGGTNTHAEAEVEMHAGG